MLIANDNRSLPAALAASLALPAAELAAPPAPAFPTAVTAEESATSDFETPVWVDRLRRRETDEDRASYRAAGLRAYRAAIADARWNLERAAVARADTEFYPIRIRDWEEHFADARRSTRRAWFLNYRWRFTGAELRG